MTQGLRTPGINPYRTEQSSTSCRSFHILGSPWKHFMVMDRWPGVMDHWWFLDITVQLREERGCSSQLCTCFYCLNETTRDRDIFKCIPCCLGREHMHAIIGSTHLLSYSHCSRLLLVQLVSFGYQVSSTWETSSRCEQKLRLLLRNQQRFL